RRARRRGLDGLRRSLCPARLRLRPQGRGAGRRRRGALTLETNTSVGRILPEKTNLFRALRALSNKEARVVGGGVAICRPALSLTLCRAVRRAQPRRRQVRKLLTRQCCRV